MPTDKLPFPREGESKIDVFQRSEIRKVMHEGEWWFSVKDILEALTGTTEGNRYSRDLRTKDEGLRATWAEITRILPFDTASRGVQNTTFINIEGTFRMMQSVPSAKAEPFKKWLAKVGFERLQEIQNPELALKRAITLYRAKGYDDEWIDARIRNKASREILTAEWDRRGMTPYIGLLTDAMSVETFGINTKTHKEIKGIKGQSLRDNMTPIELTLCTLGEQATTEIIKVVNPMTYQTNRNCAVEGGHIAGQARRQIERATGNKVVSSQNYLTEKQRQNNAKNRLPGLNELLDRLLNVPKHQEVQKVANKMLPPDDASFDDIPF
jgi:prophage antirepressor-like protein